MVGYRMKVLNFRIKKQVRKYPTNSPIMTILILMSIFYQINMRMRVTPCKMVTNIKMDKLIVIKILIIDDCNPELALFFFNQVFWIALVNWSTEVTSCDNFKFKARILKILPKGLSELIKVLLFWVK